MHKDSPASSNANKKAWPLIITGLLAIGLGVRIFGAWCLQHSANPDYGIVGIMAKHIAEGRDYPVFYYGQSYMGSLEPMVNALFYRLSGNTSFGVCLGTAWLGFLLLPVIYAMTRDIKNRDAGLAALLFSIIGSSTYYLFLSMPRGGYASMVLLGTLTLWLAIRLTQQDNTHSTRFRRDCILLGLCAGLGWWSNQLIIPFLITAMLLLLTGLKRRAFTPMLILGGSISFFAGSLPWWAWNYFHHWRTFQFGGSLGQTPIHEGLSFFGCQILEFFDCYNSAKPISLKDAIPLTLKDAAIAFILLRIFAYLVLIIAYLRALATTYKDDRRTFLWTLSPLLLIFSMGLVFCTSHFAAHNAVRYMLPTYPALAVIVGIGTARLVKRSWAGALPLLLIIALQAPAFPSFARYLKITTRTWQAAPQIADFLKSKNVTAIRGAWGVSWMNFASDEALCVAGMDAERYVPYERQAETAENVAYFADHLGIGQFLAATGGKAECAQVAGYSLLYNLQPPPAAAELPRDQVKTVTTPPQQTNLLDVLSDVNLETSFECPMNPKEEVCLEWALARPTQLCGVRIFNYKNDYPRNIRITAQRTRSQTWEEVLPPTFNSGFFWSGNRVYWLDLFYFMEARFPADEYTALRIYLSPGEKNPQQISAAEIRLLQPTAAPDVSAPDMPALIAVLKSNTIERLYAPRWISEKIYQSAGGSIQTFVPDLYIRKIEDKQWSKTAETEALDINARKTALMTDRQHAWQTRYCLKTAHVTAEEIPFGNWVLFVCYQAGNLKAPAYPPIQWTETGCFLTPQHRAKKNAYEYYHQALAAQSNHAPSSIVMELLTNTLAFYPAYQPALETVINCARQSGRTAEADSYQHILQELTHPHTPLNIKFPSGIELVGMDAPATARCGSTFPLTYYWKCPAKVNTIEWAVFVHFLRDKKNAFTDDHILMSDALRSDVAFQPFPEIFRITRTITVPTGTAPGDYNIRMGIYHRQNNKRLKPTTTLPTHKNAVMAPLTLTITE